MSFRERKNILLVLGAKDFLNHIGGLSLAFMIYPHKHFSEKAHADKLDPNDDQESSKQKERSSTDLMSEKDLVNSQVEGYKETEKTAHDANRAKKLDWFC